MTTLVPYVIWFKTILCKSSAYLPWNNPFHYDVDIRAEKWSIAFVRVYNVAEASANLLVRGQYGPGDSQRAYRDEDNVPHDSNNDTFVAGKLLFDNYRWSGTPFYIELVRC